MKKILVPTDFSPVAENAIRYAIELASKLKSELVLCHVYSLDRFNYDLNAPKDDQPYAREVEKKMKRTVFKFKDIIAQNELSVRTVVEQENIFSLFNRKVKRHRVELIVMGSKGATGLKKVILGSVAAAALDTSEVPVLVVPPDRPFSPLKHIVLAIDHNGIAPKVVLPLQKLALQFGSDLTVLNVNTGSKEFDRWKKNDSFEGINTTYREIPISGSINESINAFIGKENCDLLCMVRRKKSFFKRIFQKSITRNQVFSNQAPLLVLPE